MCLDFDVIKLKLVFHNHFINQLKNQIMDNQQPIADVPAKEPFNFSDFLQFRRMITLKIIPILYVIVAVIITLTSLGMMFSGGGSRYGGGYGGGPFSLMPGGFFGGLLFLILGNIFWRMWCEFILVLFRINKNIQDVEKNTRRIV